MWNNFVSYFTSTNLPQSSNQELLDSNCDWVFVNKSGQEISEEDAKEIEKLDDDDTNKVKHTSPRLSPLPLLDITNKDTSSDDSPSLSPSKMEDGWYITPPPCFTANCPTQLEISPLEDLLIEHPSMSVYSKLSDYSFGSSTMPKTSSLESTLEEEEEEELADSKAELLPLAGFTQLPKEKKNTCTANSHQQTVHKKPYELKNLFNQIENHKPVQHAKYHKENYKLRPSVMHRQNLVRGSRNAFNSKKKCVVKPFGEKCKRSF